MWGTPLLTEQMGKMFISDGICLPIPTGAENKSGVIQVTLWLAMPQQKLNKLLFKKKINLKMK